jgi:hypothetical protein
MEPERPGGEMEPEPTTRGPVPPRRVVASYDSYAEAQRAVDYLSDEERFPVERVSIVAEDLRFVEQVTGRRGYGQALLQGAGSGAVIGAIFGFFLGLFSLVDPVISALLLALYGLIFGAILGALIGLISQALTGGRRDFSSVGAMEAGRYNVMADEEVAEEASRLLAGLGTLPQAPSGDVQGGGARGYPPRVEEEAVTPTREAPPETPRTGDVPPREEPVTEVPSPGEERPERRGEAPTRPPTPREEPPPGEERPGGRTR